MKSMVKYYTKQKTIPDWKTPCFIFDANVLLSLYRTSKQTREKLLEILTHLSEKIWLPHQIAKEFFQNRATVIEEMRKAYDEAHQYISDMLKKMEPLRLEESEKADLKEKVTSWLKSKKTDRIVVESHDSDKIILPKLLTLFDGKIGPAPSEEDLHSWSTKGEKRFNKKIPPGFQDWKKDKNNYGDFYIWKEIIDHVKDKQDVVFVTAEKKEDWWMKCNGNIIALLPELKIEFEKCTNREIMAFYWLDFINIYDTEYSQNTPESIKTELDSVSDSLSLDDNTAVDSDKLNIIAHSPIEMDPKLKGLAFLVQRDAIPASMRQLLDSVDRIKRPVQEISRIAKSLHPNFFPGR